MKEKRSLETFLKTLSVAEEILIISDIHFGSENKEKENIKRDAFKKILTESRNKNIPVILLGDIFDFLFDFGGIIESSNLPILSEIYWSCRDRKNLVYILGNHDFWGEKILNDQLKVTTLFELSFNIENKKFWLCHGETIEKNTSADKMFRWMIQNKFNINMFRFFHPKIAQFLARSISKMSRGHSNKLNYSFNKYIDFARSKWKTGIDYVIVAHLHQPFIYREKGKYLIVAGDWLTHSTILVWKKGKFFHRILEN